MITDMWDDREIQSANDSFLRLGLTFGGLKVPRVFRFDRHTIIYKRAARRYKTVGDANRAYRDLWRNFGELHPYQRQAGFDAADCGDVLMTKHGDAY